MSQRPGTFTVAPPANGGAVSGISVFGCRYYSCQAGKTIDNVPDYDAYAMAAEGWSIVGATIASASSSVDLSSLSIVTDGNRSVLSLLIAGIKMYVSSTGVTADISQATDIRGPAAVVGLGTTSDTSANLTLDPVTGDVFQTGG